MDDFINEIKRDPQVQIKVEDMSDNYIRLLYKYQSKIEYDTLIQNVILEEMIYSLGATIVDIDVELEFENSRKKCLENIL